jgi:transposase
MAKDWERGEAEKLYIKEGKTAKDIANLLKVTEKTIGKWVDDYNWKERRASHMSSVKSGAENINELINIYAEKAISLEREKLDLDGLTKEEKAERMQEIVKEKVSLVDSIAKLNKTKEGFEKENRIPYNVYINVAEQIMAEMLNTLPEKLHPEILDFFEDHINNIALNYK